MGITGFYACTSGSTVSRQVSNGGGQTQQIQDLGDSIKKIYSTNDQMLAKGQQLFEANCSACHNFLQKGIGPNLGEVTSQVSPVWLTNFIRNAPGVITAGDTRATRLFQEYKQYMPPFPSLSDADIQAILSYIHQNQNNSSVNSENEMLGEAIKDPVSAKIAKTGLRLILEEVLTAPASADKVPLARINKMLVLPGKKDRMFIQDLRGKLYEMQDNTLHVVMDMNQELPGFIHASGLATGFGSYAFHPEFYKNGLLYTSHTEKPESAPADFAYNDSIKVTLQWVVTEWKMKDPAGAVFSGSGREMMRINVVSGIHGMQELTFNPLTRKGSPDYGLLYIGVGDGGASENGYYFLCNSWERVWSSVLRIDPQGRNSRNGRYGIPQENPFARDDNPATLGEIYCRGFRNPNRIIWTPDGKMLITDIGHANAEEINLGIAGADYGWPEREGTFLINYRGKMDKVYALPKDEPTHQYTYPVAQYDHDEGKAISGGFVYTGNKAAQLKGKYIFGDIVTGRVFYVDNNALKLGQQAPVAELDIEIGGKVTNFQELSGSKKTDLRFGVGVEDEFYLFTKADGKIYRISGLSQ